MTQTMYNTAAADK